MTQCLEMRLNLYSEENVSLLFFFKEIINQKRDSSDGKTNMYSCCEAQSELCLFIVQVFV